ncbi:MAG: DUF2911 domain-containing protein [Lewinellaceae bacterium]|nr:DUF2911 domain-containing protein [Saprospiraceae bacterium]MCB9341368.1 DUF2911 domain-containing protein [Lewinellaceae bacterium]
MKKAITLLLAAFFTASLVQAQFLTLPPASKKAAVAEYIGLSKVAIDYHRPGVKGREGKIYGDGGIVPYDGGNPMPWRAGADENTVLSFDADVTINGQALKAGKYGFHIIPAENEWTLIFSNNSHSWGSFFYDAAEDALRVNVKPATCEMTEWLTYDFVNQTDNSADIRLRWERKQISFTVATDVHANTMASIEAELEGIHGFGWQSYDAAAQYCAGAGKDLDKALAWSERATNVNLGGVKNFQTLSTKSLVLDKMGKKEASEAAMAEALPLASITELHFYGRQLITDGKNEEALKVFRMNREKHPEDKFTTIVGLARGNMAVGNYKDAAMYFKQASENAPQGQANFYVDLAKQCEEKLQRGG